MKFLLPMMPPVICALLLSCSSGEEQPAPVINHAVLPAPEPAYDNFEKGKVLNRVILKGDSSQNYALYVPSGYTTEKKYPVIYFFDPHAGGHIPINKYKNIAEKYGYIIIGTNNTENGMKMEATALVIKKLVADTRARMAIDSLRVYACGFSGGSRVASSFAIIYGGISGVIACGAGIGTKKQPVQKFSFLGLAGNEDFNYTELKQVDQSLENSGWSHFFLEFNGKHEWPPAEVMDDAFAWLELNAMHDNIVGKNNTLIKSFISKNEKAAKEFNSRKDLYNEYKTCKKLSAFTSGLLSDSIYEIKVRMMEKEPALQELLKHKNELEAKEDEMKKNYAENLQVKDDEWWAKEIKKLNAEIKTLKDREEMLIRKRVLSYLSLAAYMSASGAIRFQDYTGADHFLKIYEAVDPENSEHAYLRAIVYIKQNDPDKAIASLRKAVKLGFSDYKRLHSEKDLLKLNEKYHEFGELLETVKANASKEK